jgi:rhodanese-related sulfurtransferase
MKAVYKRFYVIPILILILIVLTIYYLYQYATDSPYRISSNDAKNRIKNKEFDLILDVRTDLERDKLGFYPGSVHIQSADLEEKMQAMFPNKNLSILAYCNTGHRARLATDKLRRLGYNNVVYISSTYKSLY